MLTGVRRERGMRVGHDPFQLLTEAQRGGVADQALVPLPNAAGATAVTTAPPAGVR